MRFSHNGQHASFVRIALIFALLISSFGFTTGAGATAAQNAPGCTAAIAAPLNHTLGVNLAAGEKVGFVRLEIPSAGLLDLETTGLDANTRTRVAFLGARCRPIDPGARSFGRHQLLEIAQPGSYYAAITTDEAAPGARFVLRVGFASGLDAGSVEVVGAGLDAPPPGTKGDELDELLLDPGGNFIYYPENLRFSLASPLASMATKNGAREELGTSYSIRYVPVAVCPSSDLDDHGATPACATELAVGSRLDAELTGAPDGDQDAFTFVLEQRSAVVLEASSDVDVLGTLLDASGAGLAQGRGGPHADVHIVSTLEAGRYYLRVAAGGGTEGRYQLRLDAEGIDR